MTAKTIGRRKRRGPIEPAFTTAIPWSRPRKGTCECPQTTTDARSSRARRAGRRGASVVNGDVEEKQRRERAVSVADVDRDDVGNGGHLRVDVAADGREGRESAKGVEHSGRADVAGVQDVIRSLRRDDLRAARVRLAVRIGHDHDAQGTVGAKLERLAIMNGLPHGNGGGS